MSDDPASCAHLAVRPLLRDAHLAQLLLERLLHALLLLRAAVDLPLDRLLHVPEALLQPRELLRDLPRRLRRRLLLLQQRLRQRRLWLLRRQ